MGWTSYHATHYKRGTVDRKAECDAYFLDSLNRGFYRIEKSTMVGSVYYAAVTAIKRFKKDVPEKEEQYEDIPESEQRTFGVVFLTSVDMKDYYNFSYKDMEETCGPYNYDCPESILKLLSPTTSEFALQWREKCREHRKKRMDLDKFPVGTIIEFEDHTGETKSYVKHEPAFQFQKPFWYNPEGHSYVPKHYIPDSYRVVNKEDK